ncbi:MAG: hypothetical protein AAF768_00040 [Pseudomonadota bacterium]
MERGWDAVRGLVSSLSAAFVSGGLIRAGARREAVILIRQAEALVRRAILIMALRLPQRAPSLSGPASAEALTCLRALPKAHVPAFPLTEPQPTTFAFWVVTPGEALDPLASQASIPDVGAADPDQFVEPGQLLQRLTALQNALEAPERQARRMAGWLTRQRRARVTGPARINPLKLGHPPTVTRQRRQKHPRSTQALSDLHHFTQLALDSS